MAFALPLSWLLAALIGVSAPLSFDRILLKDGRTIECTVVPSSDPAIVKIKVRSVEVPIRADLVDKTWIENLEGYVPKNDQEKEYLKKGLVVFEGSWMSAQRRAQELKKRADADKAYIDEQTKRQSWRNAVTVETRHFTIKSNLEDSILKNYVDSLEAYYKSFMEYWGITLSPSGQEGKPHVYLYRTWMDYTRDTGMPPSVGGFFSPVTMELRLYHDPDKREGALPVMFHEGNHLLTHLLSPTFRYPIWMNEGMAEYYGTARLDAKGNFNVGRQQDARIVGMRQERADNKFRKLADVLTTKQGTFDAYDYGYAWSFTHFLMTSPKYGSAYRGFFANLEDNKDIHVVKENIYGLDRAAIGQVELPDVLQALEKRLGKTLPELEAEWLKYFDQAYGELGPEAYYQAAWMSLSKENDSVPDVKAAVAYYEKAVELGITDAACYRDYAEMLRKGGIREGDEVHVAFKPDQARAWEMIQKAIELDPIGPLNYCEAAAILIIDGPKQDLNKAADLVAAAQALGGPRNATVKSLTNDLMALIEPAREKRANAAKAADEAAKTDARRWYVAFFFVENTKPPDNLTDLTTQQVSNLIRAGKVKADDNIYQSWRVKDPKTGELVAGTERWDKDWVKVKDCTVFKDDLAAAATAAPAGGAAPAAGGAAAPASGGGAAPAGGTATPPAPASGSGG